MAPTGGARFVLVNTVNFPLTVVNQGTGSSVGNRINVLRPQSVTLVAAGSSCAFVFDATGNNWVLEHIGSIRPVIFDARDYGVIGDGTTDNLAALNAVMTAAVAAGGGVIQLPVGTIVTSNTWNVTGSNITIQGAAYGQSVIQGQAGADFLFVVHAVSQTNLVFQNLVIDGNKDNRHGIVNAIKCGQLDSCTDALVQDCIFKNSRGTATGGSVGWANQGVRITMINCRALNCGDPGFISDGFYNSGTYLILSGCFADTCLDTGFVFENASFSGGSNLRSANCGAGLAIGVAGNSDAVDNFFTDVMIINATVGIEFGLFGPNTNTGKLKGTSFSNIIVDCPSSGFPALFFYPNPQSNPGGLTYNGRTVDTSIENFQVVNLGTNQGIYITYADRVTILGGYLNVNATAIQSEEGSPTNLVIDDVICNLGASAVFGMFFGGVVDVSVQNCTIHGGAATQWGIYFTAPSSNLSTGRNRIEGGILIDESGIGGDTTVQPRSLADGPIFRALAPTAAGTGIWPLGFKIFFSGALLLEDATHPEGWIVTTAGVPGTAIFTPFFRDMRTVNNGGALDANALSVWKVTTNDSLAQAVIPVAGHRAGIGFASDGSLGGIDAQTDGEVKVSGSLLIDLGISSGAYPWAFTAAARIRKNTANNPAVGFGGQDPSVVAAIVQIQSGSSVQDQLYFNPVGSFPTSILLGGMTFANPQLAIGRTIGGGTVRENLAIGVASTGVVTPGSVASLTLFESPDLPVTNMQTGDLVKVTPPAALEAGYIWCWVAGGVAGTVRIRIFNGTGLPVAGVGRTWTFTVEH